MVTFDIRSSICSVKFSYRWTVNDMKLIEMFKNNYQFTKSLIDVKIFCSFLHSLIIAFVMCRIRFIIFTLAFQVSGPEDRLNYNVNSFVFAYIGKGNRWPMASRCVHFNPLLLHLCNRHNNNNDNTEIDWMRWKLEPFEFQCLIGKWAWEPRIPENTWEYQFNLH